MARVSVPLSNALGDYVFERITLNIDQELDQKAGLVMDPVPGPIAPSLSGAPCLAIIEQVKAIPQTCQAVLTDGGDVGDILSIPSCFHCGSRRHRPRPIRSTTY